MVFNGMVLICKSTSIFKKILNLIIDYIVKIIKHWIILVYMVDS